MRCLFPSLIFILIGGCAPKLNLEKKSFDLDINGTTFELQAVKSEQKINVVASATGGPIDVYVFLAKNKSAAERDIMAKRLGGLIASEEGKESVTLQATIPANEEALVMVKASTLKKTTASVKINN
jgi:hypothetical protein